MGFYESSYLELSERDQLRVLLLGKRQMQALKRLREAQSLGLSDMGHITVRALGDLHRWGMVDIVVENNTVRISITPHGKLMHGCAMVME